MKVLWTHNFDPSIIGSGVFMHNFAKGMSAYGINVELMYLGRLNTPAQLFNARMRVRKCSSSFDIVHAQFGSACAFVTSVSCVPKVVSLRGSDWHFYLGPDLKESWHGLLANIFTRISLSSFDSVVTMSKRMNDGVLKCLQSTRIVTIPDPVDTTLFKPLNRSEARLRLFDSDSVAPWVLFTTLSENNPVKRANLAVESVRIAAKRIQGLELKVANGIHHDQMPLFVASCNLAICTSTHEGWPNSLKESLACGLPFVSNDVSDLADIAARHPSCKIGPADPAILADMIFDCLQSNTDETLSNEVSEMSMEVSCRRLTVLYRELLGR